MSPRHWPRHDVAESLDHGCQGPRGRIGVRIHMNTQRPFGQPVNGGVLVVRRCDRQAQVETGTGARRAVDRKRPAHGAR